MITDFQMMMIRGTVNYMGDILKLQIHSAYKIMDIWTVYKLY